MSQAGDGSTSLPALAGIFLRLGLTSFGGPAAHLAMMEREFVGQREWLTREEFLDMIGAANLVPGPSSTQVAIHLGLRRAGVPGLIAAGVCFILPAAILVGLIAAFYVRFGSSPSLDAVLYGIKPVVLAIIGQAIYLLGRTALNTWPKGLIAVAGLGASLLGILPIAVLFGSGIVMGGRELIAERNWRSIAPLALLLGAVAGLAALPMAWFALQRHAPPVSVGTVFLYFLTVGSVIYGSGYVLMAFLEQDLVLHWHWLSRATLLDAIAVGQFTPGPVFTTATFVGYLLAGPWGAAAGTVGIFLPAFGMMWVSAKLLPKIRNAPVSSAFLDGINAAAIALMSVVLLGLSRESLPDGISIGIGAISLLVLLRFRVNSALLIVVGGLVGFAARALGAAVL